MPVKYKEIEARERQQHLEIEKERCQVKRKLSNVKETERKKG